MKTCEASAEFIEHARKVRQVDQHLINDIRYLWWALSEIRGCTQEPMEVLDCSANHDGLFASLMASRMKPCEAHYLFQSRKREQMKTVSALCGVSDYVVPILDGQVPTHNAYDAIIIDPTAKDTDTQSTDRSEKLLRAVLCGAVWRFSRIFILYGQMMNLSNAYQSMVMSMTFANVPHTTIVVGRMSEQWCQHIEPPSSRFARIARDTP